MTLEKENPIQNSTSNKTAVQNQPQAAMKAVTGSQHSTKPNKESATYSLAEEDKGINASNTDNPDLKVLIKMTDEKKKDDPLLKSLVKSMPEFKNIGIDEPTVNVPLLSESSSSESDGKRDEKGASKKKTRSKSRSKSRNKNRKAKK